MLRYHVAALQQNNGDGHGGEKENQGNVDRIEPRGPDSGIVHGFGQGAEVSVFWSSMTRVLEVLAPLIPSLNAPVIFELIFRTFRFQ